MTTKTNTKTARKSQAPSHIVWFAPERENAPWTRSGARWPTKTGNGYRQMLEFLPTGPGNILVMANEPKDEEAGE